MKTWVSFYVDSPDLKIRRGQHQALWAAILPYRPPAGVIDLVLHKGNPYFVKIGHGPGGCPEIYSADSISLLSAGGTNRGERSLIVARPITLITAAGKPALEDIFYLAGPGDTLMTWNNTGVYRNFACAAGPVHVPGRQSAVGAAGGWRIFSIGNDRLVAVYSSDFLGVMAVCNGADPEALVLKVARDNPPGALRKGVFRHPDGDEIGFDVNAPHDRWVITEVNHHPVDRAFDGWPMLEISGKPLGPLAAE